MLMELQVSLGMPYLCSMASIACIWLCYVELALSDQQSETPSYFPSPQTILARISLIICQVSRLRRRSSRAKLVQFCKTKSFSKTHWCPNPDIGPYQESFQRQIVLQYHLPATDQNPVISLTLRETLHIDFVWGCICRGTLITQAATRIPPQ